MVISASIPALLPAMDSATLYRDCRSKDTNTQFAAYNTLWSYLLPVAYQLVRSQPDADDVAQECTQRALVRIHQRLHECHEPAAFRSWARRMVSNLAIDELRRQKRLTALPDTDSNERASSTFAAQHSPDLSVLAEFVEEELRALIAHAPISDRSRRVVIGRFLDDLPDETLAQTESELNQSEILPSHVQVTRAKNLAKLRDWPPLRTLLSQP